MTNQEMIQKFKLTIGFGIVPGSKTPQKGLKVNTGKPTAEEIEYIKAHKAEIIAEIEAEEQRKKDEAKAAKEAKINAIKSGEIKIKLYYNDGEYLSGYSVHSEEAELLQELKLAEYISGWGYYVKSELVKALGEEFTYEQAAEFARPKLEAIAKAKAEKEAKRQAIFDEAKRTGQKQLLRQWSDECNDPNEDCSVDNIYEYAMPDGSTKIERYHTW